MCVAYIILPVVGVAPPFQADAFIDLVLLVHSLCRLAVYLYLRVCRPLGNGRHLFYSKFLILNSNLNETVVDVGVGKRPTRVHDGSSDAS